MTAPLPDLHLVRPQTVADAIAVRASVGDAQFIAGGTDLLVNMRRGIKQPRTLIDLKDIGELTGIDVGHAGLRIGAGVSIADVARHPAIAREFRSIAQAARQIAGPGHRAMGTVGGNLCLDTRCIYYNQSEWWRSANKFCLKNRGDTCHVAPQGQRCHAAFAGDLAPAFLVLGTEVEIAARSGRRRMPLGELYAEDGRAHIRLASDELIVAVHIPPAAPPSAYAKIRVRGAIDYPLAGVAVALAAANGVVRSLRIGITGTNSRPFILDGTDDLIGRPLDHKGLQDIDRRVQKQVQPMRTTVASAHYRRLAAAALASRLAAELFAEK